MPQAISPAIVSTSPSAVLIKTVDGIALVVLVLQTKLEKLRPVVKTMSSRRFQCSWTEMVLFVLFSETRVCVGSLAANWAIHWTSIATDAIFWKA